MEPEQQECTRSSVSSTEMGDSSLNNNNNQEVEPQQQQEEPPAEFVCALTMEIMKDPVISRYGQCFERSAIFQWLAVTGHTTCPMTRRPLKLSDLITHHRLRGDILRWQIEHHEQQDVTLLCGGRNDDGGDSDSDSGDHCCFGEENVDSYSSKWFGILTLPERDADPTERSSDDPDSLREYPSQRHHRFRHRQRQTSRQSNEPRQQQQQQQQRRTGIRGLFSRTRAAVRA